MQTVKHVNGLKSVWNGNMKEENIGNMWKVFKETTKECALEICRV